jgi:hypothetical protein
MKATLALVISALALTLAAIEPASAEKSRTENVPGIGNVKSRYGFARSFAMNPCTAVGIYESGSPVTRPFIIYVIVNRAESREARVNWEVRITDPASRISIENGTDRLQAGYDQWCYHRELNTTVAAPGRYYFQFLLNGTIIGGIEYSP